MSDLTPMDSRPDPTATVHRGPMEGLDSDAGDTWKKVSSLIERARAVCSDHHERHQENEDFISPLKSSWPKDILAKRVGRPSLSMNDLRKGVMSLSGREITGRIAAKVLPREGQDETIARVDDEYLRYCRQKSKSEIATSEAFRSLLVGGIGCRSYLTQQRNGRTPATSSESVPVHEMMWDPAARELNLRDREFHIRGRYLDYDKALRRFPGDDGKKKLSRAREMSSRLAWDMGDSSESGVKGWLWYGGGKPLGRAFNRKDNTIFLVEAEWRDQEMMWEVDLKPLLDAMGDALSPEVAYWIQSHLVEAGSSWGTFTEEEAGELRETAEGLGVDIPEGSFYEVPYDRIRYAILAGDEVLAEGNRPENLFTIDFMAAYCSRRDDGLYDWYGAVDFSKDPQLFANMMASLAVEIVAHSFKGAKVVDETGLASSYEDAAEQLTRPDGLIRVNRDPKSVFYDLTPKGLPQNVMELRALSSQDVLGNMGLSEYQTGGGGDLRRLAASTLEQVRQGSMVVMALAFDALREGSREEAEIFLAKLVYWSSEDVVRVVGQELGTFVPQGLEGDVLRRILSTPADIVITEAPQSPNARAEAFAQMNTTMPDLLNRMPPQLVPKIIPETILSPEVRREWEGLIMAPNMDERLAAIEAQLAQLTGQPPPGQEQ